MKTIVIGNGSTLLGKGLGKEVDSYDRVIRLNEYKTEGFEEDLGSKTDVHLVNGGVVLQLLSGLRCPTTFCCACNANWTRAKRKGAEKVGIKRIPRSNCNLGSKLIKSPKAEPTLGIKAITWFAKIRDLQISSFEKVWVANFDFGKSGHYWDKNHQHGKIHPWGKEKLFMDLLIEKGIVEILQ